MDYKKINKNTYRKKNWFDWVEEHIEIIIAVILILFVVVSTIVIIRGYKC